MFSPHLPYGYVLIVEVLLQALLVTFLLNGWCVYVATILFRIISLPLGIFAHKKCPSDFFPAAPVTVSLLSYWTSTVAGGPGIGYVQLCFGLLTRFLVPRLVEGFLLEFLPGSRLHWPGVCLPFTLIFPRSFFSPHSLA
uniref:Uncharacterized protein n=1 Tax=Trypanosoma congolense (strain IL3000) TaxID=1068625 RepID=G0UUG3_TRYCI|nr:hypothetical protein, unlikely [Trypanosoma congolense IL3000]